MRADDLALVERWLGEPHVARWYLAGSSLDAELEDIGRSLAEGSETHMLVALHDDEPVGWCQWYPCAVDPEWAAEIGAQPGDVGVDYAIGEPARVGGGVGTELIAVLVTLVRTARPDCGVMADPDARNTASRRVLERNGFELVAVKTVDSEPADEPMAIYRLPAESDSRGR
jgi:aminoglycoside 6'-N-acetyltransferase